MGFANFNVNGYTQGGFSSTGENLLLKNKNYLFFFACIIKFTELGHGKWKSHASNMNKSPI